MNRHRNSYVVRKAFKDYMSDQLLFLPMFENLANQLINDALIKREFLSFTGNTLTSYSCGLYFNNTLEYFISTSQDMRPPVRVKLANGEYVHLEEPYEGLPRNQRGLVPTDGKYGWESALEFLKNFKFSKNYPVALVMTTGTEYSEYLEEARGLNVLTDTYLHARQILSTNIKSII